MLYIVICLLNVSGTQTAYVSSIYPTAKQAYAESDKTKGCFVQTYNQGELK